MTGQPILAVLVVTLVNAVLDLASVESPTDQTHGEIAVRSVKCYAP